MRKKLLSLLFVFLSATLAQATTFPVGTYYLSAKTPTSGIHSGSDEGVLTGFLTFDAASNITFANLAFDDFTVGQFFTFTNPGPVTVDIPPGLLSATIYNALNPLENFAFSIRLPNTPTNTFTLTCGVDCDNSLLIDTGQPFRTYVEVTGNITAVPEPSTFVLLGTASLSALITIRRHRQLNR